MLRRCSVVFLFLEVDDKCSSKAFAFMFKGNTQLHAAVFLFFNKIERVIIHL